MLAIGCGDNRTLPDDAAPEDAAPPRFGCQRTRGNELYLNHIGGVVGTLVLVTAPPEERERMFAVAEGGQIYIVVDGVTQSEPFLDISELGGEAPFIGYNQSELGLLGLAFHPDYATNGTFFISYTSTQNDKDVPYKDVVVRYTVSADPDRADPASATLVLAIPDFAANHNGGMLEFGPDGYLYFSTGDGGSANDPEENGQDNFSLLGKMLRIDVDRPASGRPYGIPADNPFADGTLGAPEVFMTGLRNPWRFSFDEETGDLWIGDVGQGEIEEVDFIPAGTGHGRNLGWKQYEGSSCLHPPCDPAGKTFPVDERTHAAGWCAVIGGQVYRGSCYPDLVGDYIYADNCIFGLSRARPRGDGTFAITDYPDPVSGPASIHSVRGELYVGDIYGNLFRVEARRATSSTTPNATARTSQ